MLHSDIANDAKLSGNCAARIVFLHIISYSVIVLVVAGYVLSTTDTTYYYIVQSSYGVLRR
jgi:hypothetical protein